MLVDEHLAKASSLAGIDSAWMETLRHQWSSAVAIGLDQTQGREAKPVAKFHALAERMQEREADYLRFTIDERAPVDNTRPRARCGWSRSAEGIGVLTVPGRSPVVLRGALSCGDRGQARYRYVRCPGPVGPGPVLDARNRPSLPQDT